MKTEEVVKAIIIEQSLIIGENLAQLMAQNSGVVRFSSHNLSDLSITNEDQTVVLAALVNKYKELFGDASVQVCNNVIKKYGTLIVEKE